MKLILFLLMLALSTSAYAYSDREIGTASWYGPGFAGKKTSNGEVFNPSLMTAAHNSLPMGSRVRVINLTTHKSIIVKINDRGNFGHKYHRLIDLSRQAASRLNIEQRGTAKVMVVVLSVTHPPRRGLLTPTMVYSAAHDRR